MKSPEGEAFRAAAGVVGRLRANGHRAFLVGGCVRDLLLGLEPKDYDVATDATPDGVAALFGRTIEVGRAFGVSIVPTEAGPIEVATFRADGVYEDGRRPSEVRYAGPEEDVRRRDFTVNALLLDPETLEVTDLVGGVADLEARRLRAIGEAEARFREDHLRPLRAVRFAARFGFAMDPATEAAVARCAPLVADVSAERVRDELTRILRAPRAGRALLDLHRLGLLAVVLPEVAATAGVPQPPEFHPEGDVLTHTAILLDLVGCEPAPSVILGWGALLHDVGKPPTFGRAPAGGPGGEAPPPDSATGTSHESGRITFHEHCEVGARMAETIGRRLRLSNDEIEGVLVLVGDHLKFKDVGKMRPGRLRRWAAEPHFEDLLLLHRLDCLASHGDLSAYAVARAALEENRRLAAMPRRILTGNDLIAWGATPGPAFQEVLTAAYEAQLEGALGDLDAARAFVAARYPGLLP